MASLPVGAVVMRFFASNSGKNSCDRSKKDYEYR